MVYQPPAGHWLIQQDAEKIDVRSSSCLMFSQNTTLVLLPTLIHTELLSEEDSVSTYKDVVSTYSDSALYVSSEESVTFFWGGDLRYLNFATNLW